jgi:hypothetical protein
VGFPLRGFEPKDLPPLGFPKRPAGLPPVVFFPYPPAPPVRFPPAELLGFLLSIFFCSPYICRRQIT